MTSPSCPVTSSLAAPAPSFFLVSDFATTAVSMKSVEPPENEKIIKIKKSWKTHFEGKLLRGKTVVASYFTECEKYDIETNPWMSTPNQQ